MSYAPSELPNDVGNCQRCWFLKWWEFKLDRIASEAYAQLSRSHSRPSDPSGSRLSSDEAGGVTVNLIGDMPGDVPSVNRSQRHRIERVALDPESVSDRDGLSTARSVALDAARLSERIGRLDIELFAPVGGKTMRAFSSAEVARLLEVPLSFLAHLERTEVGPNVERRMGRNWYTLAQIAELRTIIGSVDKRSLPRPLPFASWPTRNTAHEAVQVLAVANFKGGSGKTTTTAHLVQYLALRGYRTLAIDLDPQASLSSLLGHRPETDVGDAETLFGAIRYDNPRPMSDVVRQSYIHLLDLVPGNLELHEFEHETPRHLASAKRGGAPFFARIAEAIDAVANDYDVIVLDCPPQLGFLTLGALCAATGIIVTVHPQMLDIASMNQFLNMTADLMGVVEDAGASPRLDFLRYLPTRFEPQDGPQTQVLAFMRSLFGERVMANAVVKSAAVSDAGLSKQTLYEVPREAMDRRTYDRARVSVDAVNREIETLIRTAWGRAA